MSADPNQVTAKILKTGEISLEGEFVWGSNYTFLVNIQDGNTAVKAVYKPTRGERPLWDFPRASLAHREAAAYLVDRLLGWNQVPATVYRKDAPFGPGSLQSFIEHDPEYHYFNFTPEDIQRLRPVVLFDFLINNADRKGSHLLVDPQRRIWLIDHGICFHEEDKLRTVIWDFAGTSIPENLRSDIQTLSVRLNQDEKVRRRLAKHLNSREISSLAGRAEWLAQLMLYPNPPEHRRAQPWPPL
jgi:uncharacterized repeat protein (TIGR03843 family)